MKSASIPSLRVDPQLREAAESVLVNGESLSSFVESSIRESISRRRMQSAFIARGLLARDEARQTGEYFTTEEVLAELEEMTEKAVARKRAENIKP
jgi:predicted transcriptional regulator